MFEEEEKQTLDGDELSEEELKQIKATPHCEHDWQHSVSTSVAQSQLIQPDHVSSMSSPESRAFFLKALV